MSDAVTFGLTPAMVASQLGMKLSSFDVGGEQGAIILNRVIVEEGNALLSYLPRYAVRMLSEIEHQWIEKNAYEGQTRIYLSHTIVDDETLVVWKYGRNQRIYRKPYRGDRYQLTVNTDYTVGPDRRYLAFGAGVLSVGDRVVATYRHNLLSDCASLRSILRSIVNYKVTAELLPDRSDRYQGQYEKAIEQLQMLGDRRSSIVELARVETMTDADIVAGGAMSAAMSEPA